MRNNRKITVDSSLEKLIFGSTLNIFFSNNGAQTREYFHQVVEQNVHQKSMFYLQKSRGEKKYF